MGSGNRWKYWMDVKEGSSATSNMHVLHLSTALHARSSTPRYYLGYDWFRQLVGGEYWLPCMQHMLTAYQLTDRRVVEV